MAWIESHDDIWTHHKTIRLRKILNLKAVQVVGHLTSLWHFVLVNAWRDANLEPWGDDGIEVAAQWDGKPGQFVAALREVGVLDGFEVHGWIERAGDLIWKRLEREATKTRRLNGHSPATDRPPRGEHSSPNGKLPYRTVPYRTTAVPTRRTSS